MRIVTQRALKSHCKNGHEFTPENTRLIPGRSGRICLTCLAETNARTRQRMGVGITPRPTLEQRFWSMVEKTDGCWLWTGALNDAGYGMISDRAGTVSGSTAKRAHRMSYELHKGPIPDGLHLLHSCDVRKCVNPDHLSVGTNQDNIADRVSKGRSYWSQQTHCKHGHEWTEENTVYNKKQRVCRACDSRRSKEYHARKRATPQLD